jgi:hypothetical protein
VTENTSPWTNYLLAVAVVVVAVMGIILIILDYWWRPTGGENIKIIIPLMISAIVSIVSLAFGFKAGNELAALKNQLEKKEAEA